MIAPGLLPQQVSMQRGGRGRGSEVPVDLGSERTGSWRYQRHITGDAAVFSDGALDHCGLWECLLGATENSKAKVLLVVCGWMTPQSFLLTEG